MQYIKLKFGWILEQTGPEVQHGMLTPVTCCLVVYTDIALQIPSTGMTSQIIS